MLPSFSIVRRSPFAIRGSRIRLTRGVPLPVPAERRLADVCSGIVGELKKARCKIWEGGWIENEKLGTSRFMERAVLLSRPFSYH
jgi:hypothetical protein